MTQELAHSRFEEEVYRKAGDTAKRASRFGLIGGTIGVLSVVGWMFVLPLKTTEPYVMIVDRTTGETERVVAVDGMELGDEEAIIQANLASYVLDRETYDSYDNQVRVDRVIRMSADAAEQAFREIWSENNPRHPDEVYGENVKLRVTIRSVTLIDKRNNVAQVEVAFRRIQNGQPTRTALGVATVKYDYQPSINTSIQDVWNNPLGFQVVEYRMDVKTES